MTYQVWLQPKVRKYLDSLNEDDSKAFIKQGYILPEVPEEIKVYKS
jgi:mRNA-degrading endonuclease RelE of RelBE toxin-antitoxin system